MTTTTTTETETVYQLPVEAVTPDPGNRKAEPDPQFVASVRTHGVMQPLIVTPHNDEVGSYRLVCGERRLRAARKVGLTTVPAIVRNLSEQEVLEQQLVENIERQNLRPTQEAVAMARLIELSMTQKALAKRIGRSAGYVRDRLKLMELPAQARRLVDEDILTIEDGLALVALVDHPEALADVLADIDNGRHGNVEWMVSAALRQLEADAKVVAARAKAEAKGLRVVDHEGYQPAGYVEIGSYRGLDVDAKAHATEPCHAVVIGPRDGAITPVCTDKRRHAKKGTSPVKTEAAPGPDADARAERAARKEATEHRREFVLALLGGRISKADVLALVLPNYLDDANANEQAAMAKLLGVEPAGDGRYDRWGQPLREYAATSEANRLRACLAFSLVQGEDALAGGWTHDRTERHREFLAAKGYEPTAYEVEQAEEAARRHQESLAQTAELNAELAEAERRLAAEDAGSEDPDGPPPDDEEVDLDETS
ncbi:MAG: ParB/RepB/Spo0J family partition protein [Actinobacteria bacterium]|nr:ParB/RepB/Spo0J family partition protein [Actinomycetota bacterium]